MKKSLAITSALTVLLVMLFSAVSLLGVSAEADLSRWLSGGEKNVTVNADGTVNVPQFSTAVFKEYIDLTDANLDVSVKMAIPFANADQFVSVVLTKDPADLALDSANVVAHRFALDGEKYALNQSYLSGMATTAYGGGYIPFANGELTVRIKNDNGTVRLYMDDTCIFSGEEHAVIYSDAVKALKGAYLGIAVNSYNGGIQAKILEVNGKNPTAAKTYAASDWLAGGEKNVTVNEDGTVNVPQFSSTVLKEYIDLTDANLDVSVKMAIPFANADQFVSVMLTKDPTDNTAVDSANVIAHRFALDGEKYALNHTWLNGSAVGLYAGGYIPFENGELTVRIKNDNGTVRLYMDDTCIFYGEEHAVFYSDTVKAMGGAHLVIYTASGNGPITAKILEVNGKNPTGVQPEPELPPVVDETAGEYSPSDWITSAEGVSVNADGTANVAVNGTAVLDRLIDLNAEGLDVSVKMEIPFANASQFVSVILTKDTSDLALDSANVIAHRFALDGDKYALNQSYLNGGAVAAYAGGYIPAANGVLTVRIKNDNGIVRLYMDDVCIFSAEEHAVFYSDTVKAMRGAYLGVAVTSFNGPITVKILEINGKNPTGVQPEPELPPVVDETAGEYSPSDWITSAEGVSVNKDGTANVAVNGTAVLDRLIDLNAEGLDVSFKLAIPFANTSQFVSVILTKDTSDLALESANVIAHRFALDGEKYALNHTWLNGSAVSAYAGGYIPFENGELTVRIKNDNGTVRLYMDDVCIFSAEEHAVFYSDTVKAMRGAYLGVAVTSFDGPITAKILEVNGKNPTGVQPEPELPPVVDETAGEYSPSDWIASAEGVSLNRDGTANVAVNGTVVLDRLIDLNAEGLDISVKMEIPFANASQFVSVILTKDTSDLALDSANVIAHRLALDGDKYALNQSYLNGSAVSAYAGGYIPFENGELTVRIKNDNGTVRLYMDDVCIFSAEEHAVFYSDTVKAMRGAYLGIAVTSFDGPITAKILEVNDKNPTGVNPEDIPVVEPATKDEWDNTGADFQEDGSIALGGSDFASLDRVIDMNDPYLDLKWTVNVEDLAHLENADLSNFCIYFMDAASATEPVFDESGASVYYRARFFIDDMDVLLYSEVILGNEINMQWGQTALQDYFMWEGDYDVEFRLYNDNGLLRLTANGKQIVPDDAVMKAHSDYLKQCGEVYFGISVAGNSEVSLKTFDGVAAFDGKGADDDDQGGNDDGGNDSPNTGDAGVAAVFAVLAAIASGFVLTMKKKA